MARRTRFSRPLSGHLAQQPAIPALDVAELRTGLEKGGAGLFGQAEATGPDRACMAAAATVEVKRNIRQGCCEPEREQ
ncbi:hypothetical protein [Rhodopila sp.]|uniref:hypothetical protein n=1 Tax=Rhodopila sp. TaxID=2480087 RepID=UPI003D096993